MRRLIPILFILLFFGANVAAQELDAFDPEAKVVQIGVGIGGPLSGAFTIPPINATLEIGLAESISAGGTFGLSTTNFLNTNLTYIYLGGRGAFHFADLLLEDEKIDLYAGPTVGFLVASGGGALTTFRSGGFRIGLMAGGRYFFTDNLGAFAEIGVGWSIISGGIALKF